MSETMRRWCNVLVDLLLSASILILATRCERLTERIRTLESRVTVLECDTVLFGGKAEPGVGRCIILGGKP